MTAITETEAAQRFSAILEAVGRGETFEVMRDGRHVASIVPPRCAPGPFSMVRQNGALVVSGGLKGELDYDDSAFDIDPDTQEMFYGDGGAPAR